MKIAIDTITDGQNYGNRLQNYALQEVIKELGADVYTLKRINYHDQKKAKRILKRLVKKLLGKPYGKPRLIRKKRFDRFNKKYIKFDDTILHDNIAPKRLKNKYDYFVIGSDQVWNAGFKIIQEDLLNYLAHFADPNQRISYAASFGTEMILPEYENTFRAELSKFKEISVREQSGLRILDSLNIKGNLVLDPTMVLSITQWRKIEKKPNFFIEEPYILSYFLGGRTQKEEQFIRGVANGKRVINLDIESIPERNIEDVVIYSSSPDEFIWLISHADCVITDSFHATALSIVFHRLFWVFDRAVINDSYRISDRITTLLGKFHLEKHRANDETKAVLPNVYDYDKIDGILEIERKSSIGFLKRALKNEN